MPQQPHQPRTEYVDAAPGVRLWTEQRGAADAPPLLLVMGAGASGLGWPDALVDALAAHHRVVRYDHRDTGRSTWSYARAPYRIADLAEDVVTVLDALKIDRAHLVGMSLGGVLAQLTVADHPERVLSATAFATVAASSAPYVGPDGTTTAPEELPGISPLLLEEWARPVEDHSLEAEMERRVTHWRLLSGEAATFDEGYFRAMESGIIAHAGRHDTSDAFALADQSGLVRTEALAATEVPFLAIGTPADPVFPPPHAAHLAQAVRGARFREIPGMGHALNAEFVAPLATAILEHTSGAAPEGR